MPVSISINDFDTSNWIQIHVELILQISIVLLAKNIQFFSHLSDEIKEKGEKWAQKEKLLLFICVDGEGTC